MQIGVFKERNEKKEIVKKWCRFRVLCAQNLAILTPSPRPKMTKYLVLKGQNFATPTPMLGKWSGGQKVVKHPGFKVLEKTFRWSELLILSLKAVPR